MSEAKTSERRMAAKERQAEALTLRRAGHSYPDIARRLGFRSQSGAYDAVMGALRARMQEPAEDVRRMEIERLDRMLNAMWEKIDEGDKKAITAGLKVMERRARLLGLDAPMKVDLMQLAREEARRAGIDPEALAAEVADMRYEGE